MLDGKQAQEPPPTQAAALPEDAGRGPIKFAMSGLAHATRALGRVGDRVLRGSGRTVIVFSLVLGALLALTVSALIANPPPPILRLASTILSAFSQTEPDDIQVVPWTEISTSRQLLQVAAVHVQNSTLNGGAITEAGDSIIIASTQGQLSYLDASYNLHSLGVSTRMNAEGLRNTELYRHPQFRISEFRTHDLLAISTGPEAWDLYASYNRFSGGCFDFVVSRIPLRYFGGELHVAGSWTDVWKSTPCIPLKYRSEPFAGLASGGRMVQLNDEAVLVSVGDFQIDGWFDSRQLVARDDNDLGKIVLLNIKTGAARIFARGLRNPQGLAIDDAGRIWETEHGPQGGDELNRIVDGGDYGWPHATYGMQYGAPPTDWPFNTTPGEHEGYARPSYVWVPSIGVSNVIAPDAKEFPRWSNTLLIASLRGRSLFLAKLRGDEVVFVEPISMPDALRDMIQLKDGRIAVLSSGGTLFLIRNAEKHPDDTPPLEVAGLHRLPALSIDESVVQSGPPDYDRQLFLNACGACHGTDGEPGIGPPLNGVVGRPVASVPGYSYSTALKQVGGDWTAKRLTAFFTDPQAFAHGTTMTSPGLYDWQMAGIIEYLSTIN